MVGRTDRSTWVLRPLTPIKEHTVTSSASAQLFTIFYNFTLERVDRLTALDTISGDGDFGENLRSGLAAVEEDTRTSERSGFSSAAKVFLDDVGGTSGPLLGLLFQELANAEKQADDLTETVQSGLSNGLAAIQRVGGAEPGDRTLVDALHPADQALVSPGAGLADAAEAAIYGAAGTAELVARRGRASYVGERAIGAADPGAVGIALFLLSAAASQGEAGDLLGALDVLLPSS